MVLPPLLTRQKVRKGLVLCRPQETRPNVPLLSYPPHLSCPGVEELKGVRDTEDMAHTASLSKCLEKYPERSQKVKFQLPQQQHHLFGKIPDVHRCRGVREYMYASSIIRRIKLPRTILPCPAKVGTKLGQTKKNEGATRNKNTTR